MEIERQTDREEKKRARDWKSNERERESDVEQGIGGRLRPPPYLLSFLSFLSHSTTVIKSFMSS
jgi:hypothetical protein